MLERLIERACPPLQDALRYWLSLKPSDALLPPRSAFNRFAVLNLLSRMIVGEIERAPAVRMKIGFAGDFIRDLAERRLVGCYLDEVYPNRAAEVDRTLQLVASGHVTWRRGRSVVDKSKAHRHSEVAVMPFAKDGVVVDHAMLIVELLYGEQTEEFLFEPGRIAPG